jgi:peptidoglycan/xylan/chitin deacetylase (PgdA/CDA1 family)
MPLLIFLIGAGVIGLSHTAPFPFVLDWMTGDRSMWRGPTTPGRKTIYLTYDDGPNPTATPALLDVLARERARATFFVIPAHITPDTAPIVGRAGRDGHGIGLHSHTRALMVKSPKALAELLEAQAEEIARLSGVRPCRVFRPHAGWRSGQMYAGLARARYRLAGWSFGMWDFNWWRRIDPRGLADRLARRASDGDIVVIHDGHHLDPRADRQRTVDATAALIPRLRARGFTFGSLCDSAP